MEGLIIKLSVGEIMNRKVHTTGQNTTFGEIIDIVLKHKVNSVTIIDKNKKIIGIITRQDIANCLKKGISNDCPVKNIMAKPVLTTHPHEEAGKARDFMIKNKIAQLPVT